MYGKMKYIRFVDMNSFESIIVFSNHMNHKETIQRIRHIEVISAGFVDSDSRGKLHCFGRSGSLNVDSKSDEDTKLLQKQVRGY